MSNPNPNNSDQGNRKRHFVFVIGAPGAGKGTLCKLMAEAFGFHHLSIGDLLREKAKDDGVVASYVNNSQLLPSEILIPLLRGAFEGQERMPKSAYERPVITLVDGFPRCVDQIRDFEDAFGAPVFVLFFQCSREMAKARVLERKAGREGDTSEVFDKRFEEFLELNPAILDYYGKPKGNGKLVEIDTSGGTAVSYNKLLSALWSRWEWKLLFAVELSDNQG